MQQQPRLETIIHGRLHSSWLAKVHAYILQERSTLAYLKYSINLTVIFHLHQRAKKKTPRPTTRRRHTKHAPSPKPTDPSASIAVRKPLSTVTRNSATPASPCNPCGWCSASLVATGAASDGGGVAIRAEGGVWLENAGAPSVQMALRFLGSSSYKGDYTRCSMGSSQGLLL